MIATREKIRINGIVEGKPASTHQIEMLLLFSV